MWQHLIEIALLGTEKKALNTEVFPPEIQASLGKSHADPEQTYLEAAALCCLYLEAGKCPPQIKGEIDETIVEETLDYAPAHFSEIFKQLDNAHYRFKEKLCNLWLDAIIRKNLIVSPDIIIDLLGLGNSFSEITRTKILKVIGNKGNWILSLQSAFQYNQPLRDELVWAEGSSSERKNLLLKFLRINGGEAIELLKTTWEQEPLVNKRIYLDLIKDFRTPEVIAFAQHLNECEFAFNPKEKKTEKECRSIVAEILLGSKETILHQSTINKLTLYFSSEKKKSFLGLVLKGQTEYQLPEESDAEFWNAANMEQTYGFEGKNYDISKFNNINQFWLSSFIEAIPARDWLSGALSNYNDFLTCFLDNEKFKIKVKGKDQPVFLPAIMQNAQKFSDNELALSLLNRLPATEAIPLLQHLKPEEFELFIRKNKYYADSEILQSGPYSVEESWSSSFSAYILSSIFDLAMQASNTNLNSLGLVMAQYLHTDAYDTLQKYQDKANGSTFYYQWNTSIYEPVNSVLQIRKLIKENM